MPPILEVQIHDNIGLTIPFTAGEHASLFITDRP